METYFYRTVMSYKSKVYKCKVETVLNGVASRIIALILLSFYKAAAFKNPHLFCRVSNFNDAL